MRTNRLLAKLGFATVLAAALAGCNPDNGGGSGNPSAGNNTPDSTASALPKGVTKDSTGWQQPGGITLGLVASENGDLKPWGDDSVKGAELAVEEFNATNDVDGKKVNLAIGDSGSKPEQGKSAAEKLMSSDKAIGLIGEVSSGITAQMGQAATEKGVPVVAVGATRTDLTAGKPNIFRVCYTDAFQGPVMAKFAYEQGCRKVAIITDKKQPYSTGLSESFRAYFTKLGGQIVDEQFYESGQTQFQGQLTNLKAKNPDGLFMSGYFSETGPLARQAVEAMPGIKGKMFGGDGWDSAEILKSGGDAILGSFFCNHYNNEEDRPEVKTFLAKWDAKWGGKPATTMGALAYDAAMLACQALKNAKTKDSAGLQAAIADTTDFKGVSGNITLKGKNGNPPKRALVVELTPDGQKFAKAYEMDEATGLPK